MVKRSRKAVVSPSSPESPVRSRNAVMYGGEEYWSPNGTYILVDMGGSYSEDDAKDCYDRDRFTVSTMSTMS